MTTSTKVAICGIGLLFGVLAFRVGQLDHRIGELEKWHAPEAAAKRTRDDIAATRSFARLAAQHATAPLVVRIAELEKRPSTLGRTASPAYQIRLFDTVNQTNTCSPSLDDWRKSLQRDWGRKPESMLIIWGDRTQLIADPFSRMGLRPGGGKAE